MISDVGIISEELLSFLEDASSPASINDLSQYLELPKSLILQSVKWLICEELLEGGEYGDDFFIWQVSRGDGHPKSCQNQCCGVNLNSL